MSDSKSSYGDPVEEPRPVDDVVSSANDTIADAEAARRDAVVTDEPSPYAAPADAASDARSDVDTARTPRAVHEPLVDEDPSFDSAMYEAHADDATTASATTPAATSASTVTASEPVAETAYVPPAADSAYVAPAAGAAAAGAAATTAYAPQPIFVQAPESPRPRGNRGAAGAIGLLAALSFGVLYLAVWLGIGLLNGEVTVDTIGSAALAALGTFTLWVPVVVFFFAFWLLGAIINRGRWGAWVIFGLLVGVAAYAGHILGALFQAPFWMLTAREGAAVVEEQLLAPLAIAAFIIGRELTIWFGSWVAKRGAKVTELNIEAQREYERTLEAGPQLTRV
ncbi:ABC transporter [Microbacterium lacus]|uniref:ABC transporter n=1 Tax=Microbacterium lacus TaxID=415217 RepID=A0ABN2G5I2_9MICO